MTIGENIKKLRKECEWTQADLADLTGLQQQYISGWERELYEPSIFNCIVLADAFGITLDELCCRGDCNV